MSKQPQEMEANSQEVLLENHIHNKHDGHSEEIPSCKHKELRGRRRGKKWFKPRK